ncbi:MAG: hypothetical protein HY514_01670 [Candidatus Aenigmarchaeota archaeon]|nr:hypothetical protein [Candidatus Aenigmarchaeota archaeon]
MGKRSFPRDRRIEALLKRAGYKLPEASIIRNDTILIAIEPPCRYAAEYFERIADQIAEAVQWTCSYELIELLISRGTMSSQPFAYRNRNSRLRYPAQPDISISSLSSPQRTGAMSQP